jgi:hypothetical protein
LLRQSVALLKEALLEELIKAWDLSVGSKRGIKALLKALLKA